MSSTDKPPIVPPSQNLTFANFLGKDLLSGIALFIVGVSTALLYLQIGYSEYHDIIPWLPTTLLLVGLLILIAPSVARKLSLDQFLKCGFAGLSLLPWIVLIAIYAFAFSVRLGFGRWPIYGDSVDIAFVRSSLPVAIRVLYGSIYLLPMIWLIWLTLQLLSKQRAGTLFPTVVFLAGFSLMCGFAFFDPWGFWDWVVD
jgi:hypothetical protein